MVEVFFYECFVLFNCFVYKDLCLKLVLSLKFVVNVYFVLLIGVEFFVVVCDVLILFVGVDMKDVGLMVLFGLC